MKIWSILEYLVFFCIFGVFWRIWCFLAYLVFCFAYMLFVWCTWCLVWCIWHTFITKDVQISLNKLCWKQSLLRFLWKKVHRLEKSTPPPVVRWWTNIRYGHTGLKKIPRHCRSDSRFPKTQLTHVWMKILNFSHFSWAIFKKSCFFSCPSFAYFHSAKPLFSKFMVFLWVFIKIKITLYSIGQRWEEGFLQIFGFSIFAPFLAIFGLFWNFLCFQWRFGVFESASESGWIVN